MGTGLREESRDCWLLSFSGNNPDDSRRAWRGEGMLYTVYLVYSM